MPHLEAVTAFFGWCSVINICFLSIATITLIALRGPVMALHGGLFGLSEMHLSRAYFQYLAQYKIAIFVFNLAPYIGLKLMG